MNYGKSAAVLKPLPEVTLPDPRFETLVLSNDQTFRPFDISDLHRRLCRTKLSFQVPKDVQIHYQTALNLMLYSWFVYEFHTVAEKHAYASLEFALRLRFPNATRTVKKKGQDVMVPLTLGPLLRLATSNGLIVPAKLRAWEGVKARRAYEEREGLLPLGPMPTPDEWFKGILRIVPDFRNDLAHGSSKLFFEWAFFPLELCADLINAIYPETNETSAQPKQ